MLKDSDLSLNERAFILDGLHGQLRLDGRALDHFRPVAIEFGDEFGNVSVRLGKTRVIARISAEITKPRAERESDGVFAVGVEFNDMAIPGFETGR